MILVEVEPSTLTRLTGIELDDRAHSSIEPAVDASDRNVQHYLRMLDRSFRVEAGAKAPPVWMYDTFKWGPHGWPVHWRDIPGMPVTDCGLMAALSTQVFRWRGQAVAPVQLILSFNLESTAGWVSLWRAAGEDTSWCSGQFAYHEGTAVIDESGELRIWDPLGRFWLPVREELHYEGIVALQLCADTRVEYLTWLNGQRVRMDRWYMVEKIRQRFDALLFVDKYSRDTTIQTPNIDSL